MVRVALYGSFFEGPVQAFDLVVDSRVGGLCAAVFDAVLVANSTKNVTLGPDLVRHVTERRAIVSEHRVYFVRQGCQHPAQKLMW